MAANPYRATGGQEIASLRVLVAFEDPRRVYREVFVRATRDLRHALSVRSASLDGLKRPRELRPGRGRL